MQALKGPALRAENAGRLLSVDIKNGVHSGRRRPVLI